MMNAKQDQQTTLTNTIHHNNGSVINECWLILSDGLSELLPMFFSQLDDDLFRLSEKAETNAMQSLLFDAMRFIRREREGMQNRYMQGISQRYDSYWTKPSKTLRAVDKAAQEADDGGLSLIDEADLEESLAVNGMIEKGNVFYQALLFPLNERFNALSGMEGEIEGLPVSPDALCQQFSLILQPMEIDLTIKLLIYKVFDRQLLSKIGSIYQNLNNHLIAKGILPTIAQKPGKSNLRGYVDETSQPVHAPSSEEMAEISSYMETFRSMQSLMDGWRQQLGMPTLSAAALSGAQIADSEEVIGVIDSLQHYTNDDTTGSYIVSAENLKRSVAQQLGTIKSNGLGRTIGRPEEDTIDMVGVIFDYILDDKNMPAAIKCLLARLQIPIIKVAILDKTFFARKNHPSRILLNDMAQAGLGLNPAEVSMDNPIVQKVEEVVATILNGFSQDISLFDDLLKDFSAFMEKEAKRSVIAEQRTLQTTQSKEKVWLAKKAVASVITLKLQKVDTPASFRTFIYNDWKDVLFLAYLRRDKNDGEWDRALETLDKMIWSITPPANPQERAKVIREIPAIVKAIKEGLEGTSLDAHQIQSLLKELELCHMKALHPSASSARGETLVRVQGSESGLPSDEVNIKDAELAEAILEIKSFLPDISNIDIEEVIMGGEESISPRESAGWLKDFVHDMHSEAASRLKTGDWIEFVNEDGDTMRAKLAWKSPVTSLCVFVNRRGVKVLELKINDLVLRMRQGRANIIQTASIPLMDRAVSFLTQSLQNPFARTTDEPVFA